MSPQTITSPDDEALWQLCEQLSARTMELDKSGNWPTEQLRLCAEYGVFRWFLDPAWGGIGWNEERVVRGYLALSAACLTTTFIITQRTGACRRIAGSENESLKQLVLARLAAGELFATVGISHLTTSRRHLGRPILTAERSTHGYRLNGFAPWVTGGRAAQYIVIGATVVENGHVTPAEILVAVPTEMRGASAGPPATLVGLSASQTGSFHLDNVEVGEEWLLAGPAENVMSSGIGATTGGHETSTLAIGMATAAINFLENEAKKRPDLQPPQAALRNEQVQLQRELLSHASGEPTCSRESLRQRANSLVLRSAQAALAAAKGSGYVVGHPAGRWCREALFFLVWSCPQPVAAANLCELAGIEE